MSCASKRPRPKDDQRHTASKGNDSSLGVIARKRAKLIDQHVLSTPPEVDVATATPNAGGDHISNGINCGTSKGDVIEGTDTAKTDRNENNCSNIKPNDVMTPELSRCVFTHCL